MNSDVFAMYESEVDGRIVPWDLLVKDVLPEYHKDLDYIVEMLDWDANTNPNFGADNKRFPKPVSDRRLREGRGLSGALGVLRHRLVFRQGADRAAEAVRSRSRTAPPTASSSRRATAASASWPVSTPSMIRFGQMTEDELFVSAAAAAEGVTIENLSESDPLVMLKHFGPGIRMQGCDEEEVAEQCETWGTADRLRLGSRLWHRELDASRGRPQANADKVTNQQQTINTYAQISSHP